MGIGGLGVENCRVRGLGGLGFRLLGSWFQGRVGVRTLGFTGLRIEHQGINTESNIDPNIFQVLVLGASETGQYFSGVYPNPKP